jgi:hypothetical protein
LITAKFFRIPEAAEARLTDSILPIGKCNNRLKLVGIQNGSRTKLAGVQFGGNGADMKKSQSCRY